jgi:hypothetical protein
MMVDRLSTVYGLGKHCLDYEAEGPLLGADHGDPEKMLVHLLFLLLTFETMLIFFLNTQENCVSLY